MADEYIKRSDVLDNIAIGRTVYPDCKKAFDGMEVEVNRFPAEDVQPVVRCKDCKSLSFVDRFCYKNSIFVCNMEWFCADGKRKDGGT